MWVILTGSDFAPSRLCVCGAAVGRYTDDGSVCEYLIAELWAGPNAHLKTSKIGRTQ